MEVLVAARFRMEVTATLLAMGFSHLSISSPLEDMLRRSSTLPESEHTRVNAQMCMRRAQRIADRHSNPTVSAFFTDVVEKAKLVLANLPKPGPDTTAEGQARGRRPAC